MNWNHLVIKSERDWIFLCVFFSPRDSVLLLPESHDGARQLDGLAQDGRHVGVSLRLYRGRSGGLEQGAGQGVRGQVVVDILPLCQCVYIFTLSQ